MGLASQDRMQTTAGRIAPRQVALSVHVVPWREPCLAPVVGAFITTTEYEKGTPLSRLIRTVGYLYGIAW
jgi:hypothetical protein